MLPNILYFKLLLLFNYNLYHTQCVCICATNCFQLFQRKALYEYFYSELLKIENSRSDEIVSYMPVVINKPWRCDIITNVSLNIGRPFSNR